MPKYYNAVLRIDLSDPDKAKSVLDSLSEALDETNVPKEKHLAEFKETVGDDYREAKSLIRNLLKRDYGLSFPKRHPMSETEIGLLGCILTAVLHTEPESVEEWCFSIFEKDAMPGSVNGLLYVTRHGSSFYEPKMVLELIRNDSPVASVRKRLDEIEEDNEDASASFADAFMRQAYAASNERLKESLSRRLWDKCLSQVLANEQAWLYETLKDSADAAERQANASLGKQNKGDALKNPDGKLTLEIPLSNAGLFEKLVESIISDKK